MSLPSVRRFSAWLLSGLVFVHVSVSLDFFFLFCFIGFIFGFLVLVHIFFFHLAFGRRGHHAAGGGLFDIGKSMVRGAVPAGVLLTALSLRGMVCTRLLCNLQVLLIRIFRELVVLSSVCHLVVFVTVHGSRCHN